MVNIYNISKPASKVILGMSPENNSENGSKFCSVPFNSNDLVLTFAKMQMKYENGENSAPDD